MCCDVVIQDCNVHVAQSFITQGVGLICFTCSRAEGNGILGVEPEVEELLPPPRLSLSLQTSDACSVCTDLSVPGTVKEEIENWKRQKEETHSLCFFSLKSDMATPGEPMQDHCEWNGQVVSCWYFPGENMIFFGSEDSEIIFSGPRGHVWFREWYQRQSLSSEALWYLWAEPSVQGLNRQQEMTEVCAEAKKRMLVVKGEQGRVQAVHFCEVDGHRLSVCCIMVIKIIRLATT